MPCNSHLELTATETENSCRRDGSPCCDDLGFWTSTGTGLPALGKNFPSSSARWSPRTVFFSGVAVEGTKLVRDVTYQSGKRDEPPVTTIHPFTGRFAVGFPGPAAEWFLRAALQHASGPQWLPRSPAYSGRDVQRRESCKLICHQHVAKSFFAATIEPSNASTCFYFNIFG